jgi:hypothetical protein
MSEKKQLDMRPGDLSDRQSVRTTFRFSKQAHEALVWLSERYAVPMKDVLHFSLEQLRKIGEPNPSEGSSNELPEQDELIISLKIGARLSEPESAGKILSNHVSGVNIDKGHNETVRRTVVITRKTLKNLKLLSSKYKLSRDILINNAILCAKKFSELSDDIDKKNLEEALTIIKDLWEKGEQAESELSNLLGNEHPIVESMGYAVVMIMNTYHETEEELAKRTKK